MILHKLLPIYALAISQKQFCQYYKWYHIATSDNRMNWRWFENILNFWQHPNKFVTYESDYYGGDKLTELYFLHACKKLHIFVTGAKI